MNILEIHEKLNKSEITSDALFEDAVMKAKKYQNEYNAFITILDKKEEVKSDSLLCGIPYALKDNFSTSNILTTGGSNILNDYVPVFDSTVYKKLKNSGATLVGKTALDELAMGGTGTTGHTGVQKNPWNTSKMVGGSSSGSAVAVSTGTVQFAIGSDTGDSVRKPAAYTGIVGFKPTYGRISRYGLFPYASSLDHVGVLTRNVVDAAIVTDILKGQDDKDMTTLPDDNKIYSELLDRSVKGKKLFYIDEIVNPEDADDTYKEVVSKFNETIKCFEKEGVIIEKVNFRKDLLKAIYATYFTISCAESTSNNANLTGFLYGLSSNEDSVEKRMFETRTKGFSELIRRRFIIGSYVLGRDQKEKLFNNACRIRRMIINEMDKLFKEYDALILPSANIAPDFESNADTLKDEYLIADNHLQIGNFGGYPSISIPNGFVKDMPTGVSITGRVKEDDLVLNLAYKLESTMSYKDQTSKGSDLYV